MEFNKKEYLNSFIGEDGIDIFNPIAYIKATLPKKFYKFYPLENENDDRTLKTLSEGKVWFGNISTMNDPFEFVLLEKKLESLQNLKPVLYEEKLSKQSYLFMKKLIEVYCELLVEKNSKEFNQKFFGMTQFIYFFCSCKDKSWENEEEYRFFKFSTADKGELVNFFDANLKLVSIYGGVNISEKNAEKLKSIANKLGVEFKTTKISNKEYKIEES